MERRDFLKAAVGAAVGAACPDFAFGMARPPGRKPNFVFILIDDMGFKDAGCYGSSFYETPNIDRLAAEGMRFTDAYAAAPVCSPTRASIMTGKYPARLNLTDWLGPDEWRAKGKLKHAEFIRQLPLEEVTIAEALKRDGYTTASIGKWHLGPEDFYPEHQGFDVNVAGGHAGFPGSYFYPYKWKHHYVDLTGGKDGEYLTDRLTDEATNFIEKNKAKPFFLYLSHYAVHTPLQAKKSLEEKYKTKAAKLPPAEGPAFIPEGPRQAKQVQDHAVYAGMIQSVDESIGRVMKKLDRLGIADNTIIIFMSDNGGLSTAKASFFSADLPGPTSNAPLRAGKGWLYEGGIREPMIIKWPGTVTAGSLSDEPVISNDFYPTILEMANMATLAKRHPDGISIVPLLKRQSSLAKRNIFWHYPHYSNQGSTPASAIRAGDFKLIYFYEDNRLELYNLKDDISERNNLSEKMPEKAAALKKILDNWLISVDARMPGEQ